MPRLRAEGPRLKSRALAWCVCAAAGAALAALAGLLGRWSASPALGWAVALGAAGLGRAAALAGPADAGEESARAWAAAGALAALAAPALLRAAGLSDADPALLRAPLAGGGPLALALCGVLAALAAGAWSRAVPRAGAPGAAAALAGAAAAWAGSRLADPALLLAAASLAVLAAAELGERPWRSPAFSTLRARAFAAAAAAGLALAALTPNLLLSIWMARLQAAYPGGSYLALGDDGARLWTAYRFSNGGAVMLRDGVLQTPDPETAQLALLAVLGQREGPSRLLLARPPEALLALTAQKDGAVVTIDDGSAAERKVLDALGGGARWRAALTAPRGAAAPNAALVFVPAPVAAREPSRRAALRALRSRLAEGAAAGLLFPAGAPERAVDAAARDAAAAFGTARVADLPKGALVLASASPARTDAATLAAALAMSTDAPVADLQARTALIRWRSAPSAK
ncbi:MAG TPA: hypothetical protein VN915_01915 [Elusimicrobiota bacterium]|nr:hypothetical protein [Elusimicrobiota bacterium]